VLTAGDYRRAVDIAQAAQHVAPREGSAFIQATAQEGRAWARLGAAAETRAALARVEKLVSPLPMPDRPEHHYRYDPAKSQAYTATTLSCSVTRPPNPTRGKCSHGWNPPLTPPRAHAAPHQPAWTCPWH